jgi:hypothetical protein
MDSFLQNMKDYPSKHPLVMFSDQDNGIGVLRLGGNVEGAKTDTNKMAVNNIVFWTGMRIAAASGFTHVLLLENDCRVNCEHWDDVIWNEFLEKNPNAIAGGSIAVFNPCSVSGDAARRFEMFLIETARDRVMPLSVTGSANLAETRPSCVFPNGAFAIYRMDWLIKSFPDFISNDMAKFYAFVQRNKTWDYLIGDKLWEEFGDGAYDRVVSIGCIYSGYGNVMSSEDERKELLTSRRIVGVHQIKTDWKPDKIQLQPQSIKKAEGAVEILIVTYARDFKYLSHCLASISKFASGFSGVTIMVPDEDVKELRSIIAVNGGGIPIHVKHGRQWTNKGMLWHMAMECRADEICPHANYIAHLDPDCIFTAPVSPDTFFIEGKPVLRYEPFESLAKRQPGVWNWKVAADNALPFTVADEGMRGHPEIYTRATYEKTRQLIETKHKLTFNEYVRSCKNEYPQTFAEYPTLSAVAIECFSDCYCLQDCSRQTNPDKSPWPVIQFWSHGAPDVEQEVWIEGIKRNVKPIEAINQILK